MVDYIFLGCVSALYIFAKAFQQLNVVFKKYHWVPVMSYVMAACEVFVIVSVVKYQDWWTVFALGTGAALGCIASMMINIDRDWETLHRLPLRKT